MNYFLYILLFLGTLTYTVYNCKELFHMYISYYYEEHNLRIVLLILIPTCPITVKNY